MKVDNVTTSRREKRQIERHFGFFLDGGGRERKHGLLRQINNRVHARTFTKKKKKKRY